MRKLRQSVSDEYKVLVTPPYIAIEIAGLTIFILGLVRIF